MGIGIDPTLQGLVVNSVTGEMTFDGNSVSSDRVLQLLDAELNIEVESVAPFTLQTFYRMLKKYPLLQQINGYAFSFLSQAGQIRPTMGVVHSNRAIQRPPEAIKPRHLQLAKVTTCSRAELTFVKQIQMGDPTKTLTGMIIAKSLLVFEDKPSMDVSIEVCLTAHFEDAGRLEPVGDYFLKDIFLLPISMRQAKMVDVFYPATAERLALDYDAKRQTVSNLPYPDLTLADVCHACLALNYNTAEERALIKEEQEEADRFFTRMDRLVAQHLEELNKEQD